MPSFFRLLTLVLLLAVVAMKGTAACHFGKTDVFASAAAFAHTESAGARYDDRAGGIRLLDDAEGGYRTEGTLTSESLHYGFGFDTVVPSWNADCPPGTWIKVELQVSAGDEKWSSWYELAQWGDRELTDRTPRAKPVTSDEMGTVGEDTLEMKVRGTRLRYRLTLHTNRREVTPVVSLVALAVVDKTTDLPPDDTPGPAWGVEVPADFRSQLVENADLSWRICGPTSTAMALTTHGVRLPTADVAHAAWDNVNRIYGNWPFLAAAGSRLMREFSEDIPTLKGKPKRFQAYVLWLPDWKAVENEILNGHPCVVSIAFDKGELKGGPSNASSGHLILARGFTKDGDVICNDPASRSEAGGRVIYNRTELLKARRGGPVIVFHPYG